MADSPYRYDSVTIASACPRCGTAFVPVGRGRYCSAACRQAVWRQRQTAPLPVIPTRTRRPATVYECLSCEARFLGEQRCPECQLFCRRVGPGGPCPQCDAPVAVADLLEGTGGG